MNSERVLTRALRERCGATATTFALCLVPILLAVGFAVDFGLYLNHKAKVQHALDMAGLASARHLRANLSEDLDTVQSLASDHFSLEMENVEYLTLNELVLERSGMRLNLKVEGTMPTSLMQLAGIDTVPLNAETEVIYGVPNKAEIVLVLDTSTSMSQTDSGETASRIDSLKTAARAMVAALIDPASSVDVEVGIVPFSNRVNVGTGQAGASWLNVPTDRVTTQLDCRITPEWYADNCTRDETGCSDDDVAGTCGTWNCDGIDTSTADRSCTTLTRTYTWYGCVEPRSDL